MICGLPKFLLLQEFVTRTGQRLSSKRVRKPALQLRQEILSFELLAINCMYFKDCENPENIRFG
jgi:hypothetical protein